jgi:hypothetical protein
MVEMTTGFHHSRVLNCFGFAYFETRTYRLTKKQTRKIPYRRLSRITVAMFTTRIRDESFMVDEDRDVIPTIRVNQKYSM